MKNYQMEVIPEPAQGTAAVLALNKNGPYPLMKGNGTTNYLCGACRNVICKSVERGQIVNLVFKCPDCGNYNHIRGT